MHADADWLEGDAVLQCQGVEGERVRGGDQRANLFEADRLREVWLECLETAGVRFVLDFGQVWLVQDSHLVCFLHAAARAVSVARVVIGRKDSFLDSIFDLSGGERRLRLYIDGCGQIVFYAR